jgi:hypothetical protein
MTSLTTRPPDDYRPSRRHDTTRVSEISETSLEEPTYASHSRNSSGFDEDVILGDESNGQRQLVRWHNTTSATATSRASLEMQGHTLITGDYEDAHVLDIAAKECSNNCELPLLIRRLLRTSISERRANSITPVSANTFENSINRNTGTNSPLIGCSLEGSISSITIKDHILAAFVNTTIPEKLRSQGWSVAKLALMVDLIPCGFDLASMAPYHHQVRRSRLMVNFIYQTYCSALVVKFARIRHFLWNDHSSVADNTADPCCFSAGLAQDQTRSGQSTVSLDNVKTGYVNSVTNLGATKGAFHRLLTSSTVEDTNWRNWTCSLCNARNVIMRLSKTVGDLLGLLHLRNGSTSPYTTARHQPFPIARESFNAIPKQKSSSHHQREAPISQPAFVQSSVPEDTSVLSSVIAAEVHDSERETSTNNTAEKADATADFSNAAALVRSQTFLWTFESDPEPNPHPQDLPSSDCSVQKTAIRAIRSFSTSYFEQDGGNHSDIKDRLLSPPLVVRRSIPSSPLAEGLTSGVPDAKVEPSVNSAVGDLMAVQRPLFSKRFDSVHESSIPNQQRSPSIRSKSATSLQSVVTLDDDRSKIRGKLAKGEPGLPKGLSSHDRPVQGGRFIRDSVYGVYRIIGGSNNLECSFSNDLSRNSVEVRDAKASLSYVQPRLVAFAKPPVRTTSPQSEGRSHESSTDSSRKLRNNTTTPEMEFASILWDSGTDKHPAVARCRLPSVLSERYARKSSEAVASVTSGKDVGETKATIV